MKKYRSIAAMVAAIKRGDIPSDVYSPGAVAARLGITRQAVHSRLKCGTLPSWSAEGVIVVDARSVDRLAKEKRGVSESQGELDVTT